MTLAAFLTFGAIGAGHAADTRISVDAPTEVGCRTVRAILADRQRGAVDGTFQFVDGDNMVCFRPPQPERVVLKSTLDAAPAAATFRPAASRLNLAASQPAIPPATAMAPAIPLVAGDGFPVRGALDFKTAHSVALTRASAVGTRIGGNLANDRVNLNSFEVRLNQRF